MDCRGQLAETLEKKLRDFQHLALLDTVITRRDLIEALAPVRDAGFRFGVMMLQNGRAIPAMSFAWYCVFAEIPEHRVALAGYWETLSNLSGNKNFRDAVFAYVQLVGVNSKVESDPIVGLIAAISDVAFSQSLPAKNIARDRRADLMNELKTKIDKGELNSSVELATFLVDHLKLRIELVVNDGDKLRPHGSSSITGHALGKLLEDESFLDRIRDALATGKPFDRDVSKGNTAKRASNSPERDKFLILPIRSISDPGLKRSEAFVIRFPPSEDKTLSHEIINSINRCSDLFLARKYRMGQTQTLTLLTRKIEAALIGSPLRGNADFERRLRNDLLELAISAIGSTAAHSFALLEYQPHLGALVPFLVHEHASIVHPTDDVEDRQPNVPLRAWRSRLSAFAFRNARLFGSVVIPDVRVVPAKYGSEELGESEALGRITVKEGRQTRSEVAIPIRRGRLVLGVINFEARNTSAFDSDIPFLEALASGIGTLITSYYQSSDATWLIDNVEFQESLHDLKNNLDLSTGADAFLAAAKDELRRILDRGAASEHRPLLSDLLTRAADELASTFRELPLEADRAKKFFSVRTFGRVHLSERTAAGLRIILRNLCNNWDKYGDRDKDKLTVKPLDDGESAAPTRLLIHASFHRWWEFDEDEQAFIAPMGGRDRAKHGLYIVGVITRALRGVLYFRPHQWGHDSRAVRRYDLNIILPLSDQPKQPIDDGNCCAPTSSHDFRERQATSGGAKPPNS